jgi:hypothetical protein
MPYPACENLRPRQMAAALRTALAEVDMMFRSGVVGASRELRGAAFSDAKIHSEKPQKTAQRPFARYSTLHA